MDKFEKQIKDALNNYEAPYDASHWTSLNKKLGQPKSTLYKWIGGTAAILAIAVLGYYVADNYQSTNKTPIATHTNKDELTTIQQNDEIIEINQIVSDANHSESITPHSDINSETNNNSNPAQSNIQNQQNINNQMINDNDDLNHFNNENTSIKPSSNINYPSTSDESINPEQAKAEVVIDGFAKCLNESFEIRPSVPKQKAIYQWDLGDGTIVNANFVNHTYSKAGNYKITLTLKDIKTQEVVKKSEPVEVTVYDQPQANFTYEFSNGVMPFVVFKNNTDVPTTSWEIVGVTSANTQNFEYSFKHKGDYVVKLTTVNENGCSSTTTQVISIEKDYNLLAPNAFSPNGDNLNDFFIPKALPLLNQPFTMLIYNRQGNLIYETNDANKPWDGINFRDGVPASDGVYVWIVQLKNDKGEIETYQGQITITR